MMEAHLAENTYWACEPDPDKMAAKLRARIEGYYTYLLASGRADLYARMTRVLHGQDSEGWYKSSHYVQSGGEQGEQVTLRVNLLRTFHRHVVNMISSSRPSFQCRTTGSDAASLDEVEVGNALLDHYWDNQVERVMRRCAEYATSLGEGHAYIRWDHYAGKVIGLEQVELQDGNVASVAIREGDIRATALRPEDVVRDIKRIDGAHDWLICNTMASKWDMASRFPKFRDQILAAKPYAKWWTMRRTMASQAQLSSPIASDMVPVYEFWHRSTDAVPDGRYCLMIGDTIIQDDVMKYENIPVYSNIPSLEYDTGQGYGELWDLLAPQQALDSVATMLVSNQENFGGRNVFVRNNSDFESEMLATSFRIMKGNEPPIPIDLGAGYVAETLPYFDWNEGIMQILSGVNDTAMGNEKSGTSGKYVAQQAAMALQFQSGAAGAWVQAAEDAMNGVLEAVRLFQKTERTITITGKLRQTSAKRFSASDIQSIRDIKIDMGSAMMRTSAGRKEIADTLLQQGVITNPEQYMEVMATGRLDPVFDRPRSQRLLIEQENELLVDVKTMQQQPGGIDPMTGAPLPPQWVDAQPVLVMPTDDHAMHISEQSVLLNDPDVRNDPAKVARISAHLTAHMNQWAATPLPLLAATGQQPPPMPPPMPGGPPMPPGAGPNPGANGPQPTPPPTMQPPGADVSAPDTGVGQPADLPEADVPPIQ